MAHRRPFTGADGIAVEITKTERVVALNASTVEILQELGLAGRIVGVENAGERVLRFGPHAREAATEVPSLGHPMNPSVEGIISRRPDLVLSTQENLKQPPIDQLRAAKVPLLILENSAKDGVEGLKRRVFFVYTHGPGAAVIYGRETGAHWLIELAGGTNAADLATGTKPMTAEALVQAQPDAIIMMERGLAAVSGLDGALKLSGVALTTARKNRAIFSVDDNIRWIGPRFLGEVEKRHAALYPAATK